MMRGVKAPVQAVSATDRNTVAVCLVWAVALLASGIAPYDRLTSLVYALIAVHGLILIYGGAYSYARTPLGFWLQEVLGLMRNPYDRIGHLAQGFVPAMVAREVLLRVFAISGRKVLFFLVVCVCLAISAFYELIEWWAALLIGADADEFLATQGDVWDTQWDLFMALVGAILAQLLLNRRHDRQLARVTATTAP